MSELLPVDIVRITNRCVLKKDKHDEDGVWHKSGKSRLKKKLSMLETIKINSLEYLLIQEINFLQNNTSDKPITKKSEVFTCEYCDQLGKGIQYELSSIVCGKTYKSIVCKPCYKDNVNED